MPSTFQLLYFEVIPSGTYHWVAGFLLDDEKKPYISPSSLTWKSENDLDLLFLRFLESSKMKGIGILGCTPRIPNHRDPKQQLTISWFILMVGSTCRVHIFSWIMIWFVSHPTDSQAWNPKVVQVDQTLELPKKVEKVENQNDPWIILKTRHELFGFRLPGCISIYICT